MAEFSKVYGNATNAGNNQVNCEVNMAEQVDPSKLLGRTAKKYDVSPNAAYQAQQKPASQPIDKGSVQAFASSPHSTFKPQPQPEKSEPVAAPKHSVAPTESFFSKVSSKVSHFFGSIGASTASTADYEDYEEDEQFIKQLTSKYHK